MNDSKVQYAYIILSLYKSDNWLYREFPKFFFFYWESNMRYVSIVRWRGLQENKERDNVNYFRSSREKNLSKIYFTIILQRGWEIVFITRVQTHYLTRNFKLLLWSNFLASNSVGPISSVIRKCSSPNSWFHTWILRIHFWKISSRYVHVERSILKSSRARKFYFFEIWKYILLRQQCVQIFSTTPIYIKHSSS